LSDVASVEQAEKGGSTLPASAPPRGGTKSNGPPIRAQTASGPPSGEPLPDAPGWYVVRRREPELEGEAPLFEFDETLVRELRGRRVAPARPKRPVARILGMATAGLALLLLGLALVQARWLERPIRGPAEAWSLLVAEPPSEPKAIRQPESTALIPEAGPPVAGAAQDEPARRQPRAPAIDAAAREASAALDRLIVESHTDDASARAAPDTARIRIFIHYAATDVEDAALARRLADHLRRTGFTVAGMRPVDFTIEQPSVRYFFEGDRRASQRLIDVLAEFFDGAWSLVPQRASDFTHHTPRPRAGSVEVWLRTS
jgi:hypothetical protein